MGVGVGVVAVVEEADSDRVSREGSGRDREANDREE